ncbi:acyl carrier protein [Streptobacillus moniliformis]|uniref:Acyl carrier protein n=1 Tax=Streptobacillus moniliformis (strain ATCC 14647 / DSM 12112 / NCTC 10651 / 9901) TaxID=519441 RepID=D1AY73_STRM9|nr:acyl carrier protein [Streptobacillus moniliformis]ACZ01249.1 phosphopantetheine-binding protein [Streptobacillus moniliformis DSM 12112]AVL42393.1 acyl carrier protein [Streptobacillus moniliformis]QXW65994.1 acyl carrier protein [Streptobacillus moniliformis]SQA13596.1 Acyl carrier protein [Streptobacillus moniliformis]
MFEEIKEIILDQLDIESENIRIDSKIVEDFGADSLDLIELASTIEEKYGFEVTKEEIKEIKTVNDLIKIVEEKRVK